MAAGPLQTFDEAAINARLVGSLAAWSYDGRHLVRRYRTGGWKSSLMVANAIGHLAETAWHHPELTVTYPAVEVRLETHDAGGITERDFDLAARIEALVTWRPDSGSALEGTPPDPRFRHVVPDDLPDA